MAHQQDQPQAQLRQVRNYRPRRNVLEELDDTDLIKRYRLDREGIEFVTDMLRGALESATSRSMAISPELKVIITLNYLATGKMQQCSGDDLGLSQPSISRVIKQTVEALASPAITTRIIKFPRARIDIQRTQNEFMQIANFPGVVGIVDGTHIRIVAPTEYEEEYVNRKHYHSINTQIVFDANYKILDVVANWPGSTHDARILRHSGLLRLFETNMVPAGCHLLGDSAYPCKRWLLTPYLRPLAGAQEAYNRAHKRTRCVVERGIGQLKRRFHVLHGEVRVSPQKTCKIILACAVLYNICKDRHIHIPEEDLLDENAAEDVEDRGRNEDAPAGVPEDGLRFRDHFVNLHFAVED
ncbi:hypothetical protein Pcinc_025667 [Petrolisthes cinctipes]|uniref:Putative nuclease HARBI1 n=1 Tax=Petrolisthes cinctipes TaxID=88211 RepID=A0AAE1F8T4_PETCI|nr:hypothetical protein Pcinc_025667 [Petrolisthes cinctipes]